MIQPYQRQLLRQLTQNNPFSSFMNTASSASRPTKIAPCVYAGYGFRFLRAGEAITKDTDVIPLCDPRPRRVLGVVGEKVKCASSFHLTAGYYRVPTPAPVGFRLLKADEIVQVGDHFLSQTFKGSDGVWPSKRIGSPAEETVVSINKGTAFGIFSEGHVTGIIRPDAGLSLSALPAPSPLEVAQAEIKKLQGELKDARHGCKSLSEVVDRQRNKITDLEAKLKNSEEKASSYIKGYAEKDTALRAMQKNARGNVVILRRDGFSKPMDICPTPSYSGYELPRYIKWYDMPEESYRPTSYAASQVAYRTFEAVNTGRKDGFGRTIFEQV